MIQVPPASVASAVGGDLHPEVPQLQLLSTFLAPIAPTSAAAEQAAEVKADGVSEAATGKCPTANETASTQDQGEADDVAIPDAGSGPEEAAAEPVPGGGFAEPVPGDGFKFMSCKLENVDAEKMADGMTSYLNA